MSFLNRVKQATATTGTGTITLGAALIRFHTMAQAGAVNGRSYRYLIEDGNAWEIGTGVYTSAGPTMTRVLEESSTGSLLNLSGLAVLSQVAAAADYAAGVFESAGAKPVVADFTLDNAGTASMADGTGGIVLTMPSSTINIRFIRYGVAPSSSFKVILRSTALSPYRNGNIHNGGAIILRNSSSGKLITFSCSNASIYMQRWAGYASFNASPLNGVALFYNMQIWRKVESDGTTLSFYLSADGLDWGLIATEALASYISSVDQVGMGSINGAASGLTNYDSFNSFALQ